ncbi:hypothetical protein NUW54_g7948 [Trametes sanguinea]|uniref:Uncharacterized protein n=1 Tax=Trametes sanguinea TaxID=158606 RepID=A0ACC1PIJ4_9APHY|nr:hypothetical protein NUW54_g7948 [Trametes sanguinea]
MNREPDAMGVEHDSDALLSVPGISAASQHSSPSVAGASTKSRAPGINDGHSSKAPRGSARPHRHEPLKISPCLPDTRRPGRLLDDVGHKRGSLSLVLERHKIVRPGVDGKNDPDGIETTWFEISGVNAIEYPPDFTPADDIELEDLFYYRHPTNEAMHSRLWIWVADKEGRPYWKDAPIGTTRGRDGRRLTLTEKKKNPSWVIPKLYLRKLHETTGPLTDLLLRVTCCTTTVSNVVSHQNLSRTECQSPKVASIIMMRCVHWMQTNKVSERPRLQVRGSGVDVLATPLSSSDILLPKPALCRTPPASFLKSCIYLYWMCRDSELHPHAAAVTNTSTMSHSVANSTPQPMESRLSQSTVELLRRISDDTGDDFENAYADALHELEQLNSCNAALCRAVLELKRGAKAFDSRMCHLEEELVSIRHECDNYTRPAKLSYRQAQATLNRERSAMESFREQCQDSLESVKKRLHAMEIELSVLKSRSTHHDDTETKGLLMTIKTWAETTTERLSVLEEEMLATSSVLEQVRDRQASPSSFFHIPHTHSSQDEAPPSSNCSSSTSSQSVRLSLNDSSPGPSLADELSWDSSSQAQTSSEGQAEPLPSRDDLPTCWSNRPQSTDVEERSEFLTRSNEGYVEPFPIAEVIQGNHTASGVGVCSESSRLDEVRANFVMLVACLVLGHYTLHAMAAVYPCRRVYSETAVSVNTGSDRVPLSSRRNPGIGPIPTRDCCLWPMGGVRAGLDRTSVTPSCQGCAGFEPHLGRRDSTRAMMEYSKEHRGRLWKTAATVRNHRAEEELRTAALAEENEKRIAATIVIAASTLPSSDLADQGGSTGNRAESPPESAQDIDNSGDGLGAESEDDGYQRVRRDRLKRLSVIEALLHARRRHIPATMTLAFVTPPKSVRDPAPDLSTSGADNTLYFSLREVLLEYRAELERMAPIDDKDLENRRAALIRKADAHVRLLETRKAEAWDAEVIRVVLAELSMDRGPLVEHSDDLRSPARTIQPWLLAGLLMASILHSLAAVSRTDLQFVLSALQAMIYGAFVYCNVTSGASTSLTPEQTRLLNEMPSDIRTVLSKLGLDPPVIRYASCPKCHRTYAPKGKRSKRPYPKTCTNKDVDKHVCGEPLLQDDDQTPARTYPFHSLSTWIGNLLSRSELLEIVRNAWSRPQPTTAWKDLWDAPGLRSFLGPDGRTPFSSQPDGAVHLVFSREVSLNWCHLSRLP